MNREKIMEGEKYMLLEFQRYNGEIVSVGKPETMEQAKELMIEYIRTLNPDFKVYYTRVNETLEGKLCIDVGSHSEFFYISDKNKFLTISDYCGE